MHNKEVTFRYLKDLGITVEKFSPQYKTVLQENNNYHMF